MTAKPVYAHFPLQKMRPCQECAHATRFRPDRRALYCAKAADMTGVEPHNMGVIGSHQNGCKYWTEKRP
ncbi:hypothetical protein FACS1894205_2240 [Alphaproteobacteria bacterium]|nr:hypothetical protein FACS1894205_2240 [Alphaproteobacteria bacterium]